MWMARACVVRADDDAELGSVVAHRQQAVGERGSDCGGDRRVGEGHAGRDEVGPHQADGHRLVAGSLPTRRVTDRFEGVVDRVRRESYRR